MHNVSECGRAGRGDLLDTKALSQNAARGEAAYYHARRPNPSDNPTGRGAGLNESSDSTLHSAKALSRHRIACRYPIYVPERLMLKPKTPR